MKIPYYQVDAFAEVLFSGNPAGVCLLEDWLPDTLLQSIAAENSLSETAFVVPGGADFALRWFTPTAEIDLCGHATLAAAHVLTRHAGYDLPKIDFQTQSGLLSVALNGERLTLDFPARPAALVDRDEALIEALDCEPIYTAKGRDFLAVFASEQVIRDLQPRMDRIRELDCLGVIVTAPGENCDFVSRFFAPKVGVDEDPVTGSAHCALIPYWAEKLQKTDLHARQISKRGGELFCRLDGKRVKIGGRAVTYSSGHLHL